MRVLDPLPDQRPGGLGARLLLAWIAFQSDQSRKNGGKAEHETSILYVQQIFRLSTDNQATALLGKLKERTHNGPWIVVTQRSRGVRGHHYALGAAALADADAWVKAGRQLFGPAGVMEPYMSRPILQRSGFGLGIHGCMCLGYIDRFGPVTVHEVNIALKTFMDLNTSTKWVRHCRAVELALESDSGLYAPRNLSNRLAEYAFASGADEKALSTDRAIGSRQLAYQIQLLGSPTIERVKSILRKERCLYCGAVPPPSGGEIEHYPPKRWGGSDSRSLLLPVCRTCNGSHGGALKTTKGRSAPQPLAGPIQFSGPVDEATSLFVDALLMSAIRYADHLNEGRLDEAASEAFSQFPLLLALKAGVRFIDTTTGETSELKGVPDMEPMGATVDTVAGVPALLGGTRGRRKADAKGRRT